MSVFHHDERLTLLHGDALEQLGTLEAGSVQTIVTSPPYFGLRDYGEVGQYGSESTVAEFVARLVALFTEARRVLADDGVLWLNLGDSYASKARGSDAGWDKSRLTNPGSQQKVQAASLRGSGERHRGKGDGIGEKNLLGVPWRTAFALQDAGWILRSEMIWHKPNAMPESVTDRVSRVHEHIFMLTKRPRYYFDLDAIRVPHVSPFIRTPDAADRGAGEERDAGTYGAAAGTNMTRTGARHDAGHLLGKNPGSMWSVPTVPFVAAHFATYPPALVRPCILAGSRPGDVVLDPFSGSGTTGMVALEHGRRYVGIDLNRDYLDLSLRERFDQRPLDIFGGAA